MGVKLHVDLETLQLIQGPGQRSAVTTLRFKRGDSAKLQVTFLENGVTPTTIGDPGTLEIQIGIKPRNQFDRSYLAHSADWSMPSEGDDAPAYECAINFNTLQLESALNIGSATAEELPEITLMGEITWREGAGEPTSTRTFIVVVENDVNRGTEGVPTSAEPPYPTPQSLVTENKLGDKAVRHDVAQTLNPTQQAQARTNIGVPGIPASDGKAYVLKNGQWVEQQDLVGLQPPATDGATYAMINGAWTALSGLTSYLSNPSTDLSTVLSSLSATTHWILSLSDGKWFLPASFTSASDAILLEPPPPVSIELFNGIATTLSGQAVDHPVSLAPGNYHIELEVVETGASPSDYLTLYVMLGASVYSSMSNFQSSSFNSYTPYYGDPASGIGYFEVAPDFTPKTASFDINIGTQASPQQIQAYISTAVYQPHLIVTATPI